MSKHREQPTYQPTPRLESGYAFSCRTKGDWKTCPNDSWETVAYTKKGHEVFQGFRAIDGMRCAVWAVAPVVYNVSGVPNTFVAQSTRQRA